jgi:hypothetical protein
MPAEFIIPNCKIQSNFTFTMASSGDPSTFTFTMDAFPGYTRFDPTKKVLFAMQVISEAATSELNRESTAAALTHAVDINGIVYDKDPQTGIQVDEENGTITINGKVYELNEVEAEG